MAPEQGYREPVLGMLYLGSEAANIHCGFQQKGVRNVMSYYPYISTLHKDSDSNATAKHNWFALRPHNYCC